jgi:hypothetical protein
MGFDQGSWARDLLTRMDYPVNQANMTALIAWQYAEGGHFANSAKFNPLNTTRTWPGAESMNSVGVKAYDNYEEGMAATIATLNLPFYKDVRAALKEGDSSRDVLNAVVDSPWGTTGLAFGTLPRARQFLKDRPSYLKPAKPKPAPSKPRPRPPSGPSGAETVIVYPVELNGLMTHLTTRIGTVQAADTAGRDVWADLNLSAVIDPTVSLGPGELPGVDRDRLHQATRELGMSLDENLGLPFVDRQLGGSRLRVERFLARLAEIEANGYRPRTRAEALRMLKALKGKLDPPGYAAMETFLLGGLRTGRPPGHRPSSPRRPPASNQPGRPLPDRPTAESKRKAKIDDVLDRARLELRRTGPDEQGYNRTRYGAWYGMQAEWCAMFVSYVFAKSGHPLPAIQGPKGFAGVPYAISVLRERGQLHSRPKVGDVFLREGRGHAGIVTAVRENADGSYTYSTIEGNAGANTDAVVTDKRNTKDTPRSVFWSPIN